MSFIFHLEAEKEFNEAIDYYESIDIGLGYDFATEIYTAIQRATAFPKTWPVIKDGIRRSLVRRFPYGVLYSIEGERLFILAVMNLHRHPDYWKHRI
jgi:hypothetical protein